MSRDTGFADRHQRIRDDHATETAEDYAEAVQELCAKEGRCRVVDLARHFGVSHVTVTKIVQRLQREGFVASQPYGPIRLTAEGEELANNSRRRHRIVLEFLMALGVDERTALVDAEGIEHHVSPETLDKFDKFCARKGSRNAVQPKRRKRS
jgi:DtxR family transcriptional regulator, manganese transport regulator